MESPFRHHARRLSLFVLVAASGPLTSSVYATDIFSTQPGALDQPQVNVQLRRPSDPTTLINFNPSDESDYIFSAFLDTGASSHLLSNATAGVSAEIPGMGIQRAQSGGSNIVFNDVGGGGEVQFNVSEELIFQLAPHTLATTFAEPGQPDFRPIQADFNPNSPAQRWQVGPSNQPVAPDPLEMLLDPLASVNVVGMPAMKNKVVVMDSRGVNTYATDLLDVNKVNVLNTFVYSDRNTPFNPVDAADPQTSENPGIPTTNRHIALSYADFSDYTSTNPAGAVKPDIAANPFIGKDPVRAGRNIAQPDVPGIKVDYNGVQAEGSFLLDTGAGASFISTNIADTLGVHYRTGRGPGDPVLGADPLLVDALDHEISGQFKISLSAFGADDPNDPTDSSSIVIAGFYLDSMLVRTQEGNDSDDTDPAHLNYVGAPVLVFNINVTDPVTGQTYPLDGVFGMNFLTASVFPPEDFDDLFNLVGTPGAFDWIVFDEEAGTLGLALPVPEPSIGVVCLASLGILARRRRRSCACTRAL